MITISITGRMLDEIYALVTSRTAGAQVAQVEKPEAPVEAPDAVEAPEAAAPNKDAAPVAAGRTRKRADRREHVTVTRSEPPVETVQEPIKAVDTPPEPIKPAETVPELIKPVETPLATIKAAETVPEPIKAVDDDWPATLTKPSAWDYDGQGASWRAANQIGTAELGAAIQRVYVDHADIIKMPSVRVAMSKLGVAGWWGCVAKNIAEARDASNKPLDITPKVEA